MSPSLSRVVVAGIGNEYRQDDGVGIAVANAVTAVLPTVLDIGPIADPLDLLGKWDYADLAVVIDATRSGAAPGTVTCMDLDDPSVTLQGAQPSSTHGLGVPDVMRLARVLLAAPQRVVLIGIEGREFNDGSSMGRAVQESVPRAAALVIELVAEALDV